jgi:hypothetical protein
MSEDRLSKAAAEGTRARELLESDLLVAAFKGGELYGGLAHDPD